MNILYDFWFGCVQNIQNICYFCYFCRPPHRESANENQKYIVLFLIKEMFVIFLSNKLLLFMQVSTVSVILSQLTKLRNLRLNYVIIYVFLSQLMLKRYVRLRNSIQTLKTWLKKQLKLLKKKCQLINCFNIKLYI